ncbi:MAG: hypothetical protein ACR2MQ_15460 [Gemmatimonadaceae bacterium]
MLLPRTRRTVRLGLVAAALVLCSLVGSNSASAQAGAEGVFLLLPVGARAVGMSEAVVAERGGSDELWWNPSAIVDTGEHELAIHHAQIAPGQQNALAIVVPTRSGAFGVSLNVLDLGQQTATDENGVPTGVIHPTDFVVGMTYAVSPIPLLALGLTLKHVDASIRCSGLCTNLPTESSSSNGADLGAQLRFTDVPLTIGAAARHLGVGSGDTRAGHFDVGGDYRIEAIERRTTHVQVHAALGVVATTSLDSASTRVGTDIILDQRLHVRAGYIRDGVNSRGSVGVGLSSGKLVFDIARTFGGLANNTENGGPPTYFSLRYLW